MDSQVSSPKVGRPAISSELWNRVIDLKDEGKTPSEVIELTGLSQTKVYEIFRYPIRRAPDHKAA